MTASTILPMQPSATLSGHAVSVLEKRFLLRENGRPIEDPAGLFRRVARAVASIDDQYGDFRREESEEIFFDLMSSLTFLPNSPTLMNAGTSRGQLAGCFVLPIEDSMESIYGTLRDVALEMLDISREGLHRRARRDRAGEDETHFLDTLFSIAGSGRSPAAEMLEDYEKRWGGDIKRVYDEYAY